MSDHADAMRTLAAAIPYATAVLVVGVNPDRPGESDLTIVSMRGANCMCGTCMDIVPDAAIAALLRAQPGRPVRAEKGRVLMARIVLDEAQHIKNVNTAAAKAVRSIPAAHRIALTGTPVENRLEDLRAVAPPHLVDLVERFYPAQFGTGEPSRTTDAALGSADAATRCAAFRSAKAVYDSGLGGLFSGSGPAPSSATSPRSRPPTS